MFAKFLPSEKKMSAKFQAHEECVSKCSPLFNLAKFQP